MTTLPNLDAAGYQALLASSAGMGHHAGLSHADSHDHDEPAADNEKANNDDGHDHEH